MERTLGRPELWMLDPTGITLSFFRCCLFHSWMSWENCMMLCLIATLFAMSHHIRGHVIYSYWTQHHCVICCVIWLYIIMVCYISDIAECHMLNLAATYCVLSLEYVQYGVLLTISHIPFHLSQILIHWVHISLHFSSALPCVALEHFHVVRHLRWSHAFHCMDHNIESS